MADGRWQMADGRWQMADSHTLCGNEYSTNFLAKNRRLYSLVSISQHNNICVLLLKIIIYKSDT
jgi:hypothetical protein